MLTVVDLASRPGYSVAAVTCCGNHARWSPPEARGGHRLVLVRQGRFRRRSTGVTAIIDPTVGYLGMPGEEESFAHPAGGDVCTSVELSPQTWQLLAGDSARPDRSTVYVDAQFELAHRRLLAASGSGDWDHTLAEELLDLVGAAIRQTVAGPTPTTPPATAAAAARDRALVAIAREAIAVDHPASGGLFPLAEFIGASPYRLSRAFPRELGVSLTHYRNRVRVSRALERLAGGELSLGILAADLGFADQAHLTRTVRAQAGHPPAMLRRLLRSAG